MKYLLSAILTLITFVMFSQHTIISNDVVSRMQDGSTIPCIITMYKQYKAPNWIKSLPKHEKTSHVYQALNNFEKKGRKEIIQYFKQADINFRPYIIFNGYYAEMNKTQLVAFLKSFDVALVSFDERAGIQNVTREESKRIPLEWGITKIKADSVWLLGYEGEGVVIAGQDTGYDFDNPLILNMYRGFDGQDTIHDYNWHDAIHEINITNEGENPCGVNSLVPCDDHGHGTHTMGTMVGQDNNNGIGVAPKAQWIACRNMERGDGTASTYTECFEWFLAPTDLNNENPDPTKSPHVINNSWACTPTEGCNPDNWQFMEIVVDNLVAAGIMVVSSAGNSGWGGCGTITTPASVFENAFVVGASDISDTIGGFSSRGPITIDSSYRLKPDVVAPGVDIRSITLDGFSNWSGTSMAGPHVAGAVALIINANPDLAGQVEVISDILRSTAIPLIDTLVCNGESAMQVPNVVYGHGRIDVYEAVKLAQIWVGVKNYDQQNILTFFPNPSNGHFLIKWNSEIHDSNYKLELYNSCGYLVRISDINKYYNDINFEDLPSGPYFYKIVGEQELYCGKLLIQ